MTKKRSLPASLAATTNRKQELSARVHTEGDGRQTADRVQKRARRLPASLAADADDARYIPDLTLSNVRAGPLIQTLPQSAQWVISTFFKSLVPLALMLVVVVAVPTRLHAGWPVSSVGVMA